MPTNPAAPTEAEVYAAYEAARLALDDACKGKTDLEVLIPLSDAAQAFSDFQTEMNKIDIEANTAVFKNLTPGMKKANEGLKKLQGQLDAINDKIADGGKVASAVDTVLKLVGKFL